MGEFYVPGVLTFSSIVILIVRSGFIILFVQEKNPQSLEDRNKIPAKVNQGVLGVEADTSLMKKRDSSRELEEQRDEK